MIILLPTLEKRLTIRLKVAFSKRGPTKKFNLYAMSKML